MTPVEGCFKGDVASIGSVDIEGPLGAAKAPCCQYYRNAYANAVIAAKEKGDETAAELYSFLSAIASFAPRFDTPRQPYEPLFQIGDRRGLTPADLAGSDLDVIQELGNRAKDPALRARLLDILWVSRKDHHAAAGAVEAYLEAGQRLDDGQKWTYAVECFRRALYLAAVLGKSGAAFDETAKIVLASARRAAIDPRGFFGCKILELLLQFGVGDPGEFAPVAETIARQAESANEWRRARHYWRVAGDWWKRGRNTDNENGARRAVAEAYISEAEDRFQGTDRSAMAAAQQLSKGIEALRRVGESGDRISDLKKRLSEIQAAVSGEMKQYVHETDISAVIDAARKHVSGATLREALARLAFGLPLEDPDKVREQVLEFANKYPFKHLGTTMVLDEKGRTVIKRDGLLTLHGEAYEQALEEEMFQQAAQFHWNVNAASLIEPARSTILAEHHPSLDDLRFLVSDNPFVPPGHEDFYLRGIHAGFHGDFLEASHLIIPQIENSLRHVLASDGAEITVLESGGTQREMMLGGLLKNAHTLRIFGKQLCFALRGSLIEKGGFFFRDRLAHGLLRTDECFSVAPLYAWWLVLRILMTPLVAASEQSEGGGTDAEATGAIREP